MLTQETRTWPARNCHFISVVVIGEDAALGDGLATLLHEADLFRDFTKPADDLLVAIIEREDGIGDTSIATELYDELLRATQVVARDPRVEMVNGLELQATVEEIQPCWAVDVHSGTEHLLREGLANTQVGGRHSEVG